MSKLEGYDLDNPKDVAEYLRSQGRNIIPIVKGTKEPPKSFPLQIYFTNYCKTPIKEDDSIAMLHGKISNSYSADLDHPEIINILFDDPTLPQKSTLMIKTPKKGFHLIFEPRDGDLPPKNVKYFNKDGMEVDIKTQGGYTLLPPSVHPETKYGRYQFISDTFVLQPIRWTDFKKVLHEKGFFTQDERRSLENSTSRYELDDLLNGRYSQGERRRKQNSLYVKLRLREDSEDATINKICEINQTCQPPLDEKEVEQNCSYAESFFQNIALPNKQRYQSITKSNEIDVYYIAQQLMSEYNFITLEKTKETLFYSNGVYREGGEEIISKRSRKLAKNIRINHIREIKAIIQDETGYHSRDEFDSSDHIVNLKNGILDLKQGQFKEHDPQYLSRVQVPIFYDPKQVPRRFIKFLKTSLDDNPKKIYTILEMIALCFIKDNGLVQKAFMHTGLGSNGKSILFGIIESCLGKENISAKTIHDFEKNRFAAAALEGKLANICADVGSSGIRETEMLKKIIGGDPIDCEKKFSNSYTFTPFATLIFSANDIPEVEDGSNAFVRRFELIEWGDHFMKKTEITL